MTCSMVEKVSISYQKGDTAIRTLLITYGDRSCKQSRNKNISAGSH